MPAFTSIRGTLTVSPPMKSESGTDPGTTQSSGPRTLSSPAGHTHRLTPGSLLTIMWFSAPHHFSSRILCPKASLSPAAARSASRWPISTIIWGHTSSSPRQPRSSPPQRMKILQPISDTRWRSTASSALWACAPSLWRRTRTATRDSHWLTAQPTQPKRDSSLPGAYRAPGRGKRGLRA